MEEFLTCRKDLQINVFFLSALMEVGVCQVVKSKAKLVSEIVVGSCSHHIPIRESSLSRLDADDLTSNYKQSCDNRTHGMLNTQH